MNGSDARRKSIESWWILVFGVVTGLAGVGILIAVTIRYLTTGNASAVLVAAGVGLCGPIIAASAGAFVQAIRGAGR